MKHLRPVLIFTTLCCVTLAAFSAHAEDGLSLFVTVPPAAGDRFQQADFHCWLPDASQPVRGVIIHQHGCTNASPVQHPSITQDAHWRALARKQHCALLVPEYQVAGGCDEWNDPESGSERALFMALEDFAGRASRPELKNAPWVLWGHSGGSSWSAQMIVRHPGRVLAASFRGGCHKQFGAPEFRALFAPVARELPILFVWGKRESVPASSHFVSWTPMNTMYAELRAQGSPVARVIDPRSEHNCDDSRLLVIPFFDAVLSAKLAGQALPAVLMDMTSLQARETSPAALLDPALACLPSSETARLWQEFSETGTVKPVDPQLAAPLLKATRDADGHVRLDWSLVPELDGGVREIRLHRDGKLWKSWGVKPGAYIATSRDSAPEGLRESSFTDEKVPAGTSPVYTLTFLDVAGNESPASLPASAGK